MSSFVKTKKHRKPVNLKIDPGKIEERYKLPKSTVLKPAGSSSDAIAKLLDISTTEGCNTFVDDNKRVRKFHVVAAPEYQCTLETRTSIPCFWDTHQFQSLPIGCPLKYTKEGDKFVYYTTGVFCSFPCCLSYILNKQQMRNEAHRFRESDVLLKQLYTDIFGYPPPKGVINIAPDTEHLFLGLVTIEKYRERLESMHIMSTRNHSIAPPILRPVANVYEERIMF